MHRPKQLRLHSPTMLSLPTLAALLTALTAVQAKFVVLDKPVLHKNYAKACKKLGYTTPMIDKENFEEASQVMKGSGVSQVWIGGILRNGEPIDQECTFLRTDENGVVRPWAGDVGECAKWEVYPLCLTRHTEIDLTGKQSSLRKKRKSPKSVDNDNVEGCETGTCRERKIVTGRKTDSESQEERKIKIKSKKGGKKSKKEESDSDSESQEERKIKINSKKGGKKFKKESSEEDSSQEERKIKIKSKRTKSSGESRTREHRLRKKNEGEGRRIERFDDPDTDSEKQTSSSSDSEDARKPESRKADKKSNSGKQKVPAHTLKKKQNLKRDGNKSNKNAEHEPERKIKTKKARKSSGSSSFSSTDSSTSRSDSSSSSSTSSSDSDSD